MRLFFAVALDESTRAAIEALALSVRARLDPALARGATWVAAANLHVTQRFLGEVGGSVVAALDRAFADPLRLAPFAIEVGGLGVFPGPRAPRVLWAGIRDGGPSLGALHDAIEARLMAIGLARAERPYHPHVTLARFAARRLPRRVRLPADLFEAVHPAGRMSVTAVTLFESRLSPGGSTYVSRLQTPLAAPAGQTRVRAPM